MIMIINNNNNNNDFCFVYKIKIIKKKLIMY